MSAQKSAPSRKCLGCNEMKDKKDLLRVVRDKDGNIFFDRTGKAGGRGAYICRSVTCFNKCRKGGRFEKSFGAKIDDSVYDGLLEQLGHEAGDRNG
jgi:predicted RNA-binding protein YlxR (DUF448 family)